MAAVRARRPSRRGGRPVQQSYGMPRMAMMKLEGAQRVADSFKKMTEPGNLKLMLASAVIMAGAAVAGAAWIGGSLFDARETIARGADRVATNAGFGLKAPVEVSGVGDARAAEVRAVVMPEDRASLFAAAPADIKQRVEALPWVERATVRRLWPSTIRVDVVRRQAYALWRHDGQSVVIDAAGAPVKAAAVIGGVNALPVVVGAGAGDTARPVLVALENMPDVRAHLKALVRVGGRRWNLDMKSGMSVALPEIDPAGALQTLAGLQQRYGLLDRPLARVDLRVPQRLIVLPRDALAGGPGMADDERASAARALGA